MKKAIGCLLMVLASALVQADVLNWMVSSESSSQYDYVSAHLYMMTDGKDPVTDPTDKGYIYLPGNATVSQAAVPDGLGDTTAYSFYVELIGESGNVLAVSDVVSYAALRGFISTGKPPTANIWDGGHFTAAAVPEPTSGLLMLLGLAGLALRRRNV